MCTIAEVHSLEIKNALSDFQLVLTCLRLTVQPYPDTGGINTGGILIGQFAIRIYCGEAQIAAGQNGGAVCLQHRAAARLRNGFHYRAGNVIRVCAVDELDIIYQDITLESRRHRRRLDNAVSVGTININRHLHRGNIGLYPNPTLTCHVAQCGQLNFVSICIFTLTIVLGVHGCTLRDLTLLSVLSEGTVGKAAVRIQCIITAIGLCILKSGHAARHYSLKQVGAILQIYRYIDPHADLGGLYIIHIQVAGKTGVCRRCSCFTAA